MKQERSAGIVTYYIDPASPDRHAYLLLDYGRHWDYPKGHVDKGEDDRSAAKRELLEETGLDRVDLVPDFAQEIVYFFKDKKKGSLIKKTVVFFLGRVHSRNVKLSHEHVGFTFLPYDESRRTLTYASARKVLDAAEARLGLMKTAPES